MSTLLLGLPRRSPWVFRCRRCAGEVQFFARYESFRASKYAEIVEAARSCAMNVAIKAPNGKHGETIVDFFPRSKRDHGSIGICSGCGRRCGSEELSWPEDAFYQTSVRGVCLWALDRTQLVLIREYIARKATRGQGFHKLPKTIVSAKNRDLVLKKIDELLADS